MADDLQSLLTNQKAIIDALLARNQAGIRLNSDTRPRLQLRMVLPLDVAATAQNPFPVSNPFNGFYVESTSDSTVSINLSLTSPESQNMLNYTALKQNDSANFDEPIRAAYLTWASQPGKSLTIIFYLGIGFRPGTLNVSTSGGVSIGTGSGMTPAVSVLVTNAATALLTADASRKKATLQNLGTAPVFISGTNAVVGAAGGAGVLTGIQLLPGATYEWMNTGTCFGITDSGSSIISINKEA